MSKFEKIIELFISKDSTFIGQLLRFNKTFYLIDYRPEIKEFRVRIWQEVED